MGERIAAVSPGRFGTSDDVVSFVDAGAYGSTDTEDPEFDPATGHLFFLDGVASEVYEINPVNGVFGDGNDQMTHFDVGKFGAHGLGRAGVGPRQRYAARRCPNDEAGLRGHQDRIADGRSTPLASQG